MTVEIAPGPHRNRKRRDGYIFLGLALKHFFLSSLGAPLATQHVHGNISEN